MTRPLKPKQLKAFILLAAMLKLHLEIDKEGALYFILSAFLGAYNRRTDFMAEELEVRKQINRLQASSKSLNHAIEQSKEKT